MEQDTGSQEHGSSTGPEIRIRPAIIADIPFIFNSWLKSYRDSPSVRNIPNSIYFEAQHKLIEGVLGSPTLNIWVACQHDKEEQIFGYLVAEKMAEDMVIHFAYVKFPERGKGIARALEKKVIEMEPERVWFTAQNKSIESKLLKERKYHFNPYLFWSKL